MTDATILDLLRRLHAPWSDQPISVSDERALDANRHFFKSLTGDQWRLLKAYLAEGCPKDKLPKIRHKFIETGADAYLAYACVWRSSQRLAAQRRKAKAQEYRQALPGEAGDHEALEVRSEPPDDLKEATAENIRKLEEIVGRKFKAAR